MYISYQYGTDALRNLVLKYAAFQARGASNGISTCALLFLTTCDLKMMESNLYKKSIFALRGKCFGNLVENSLLFFLHFCFGAVSGGDITNFF